MPRKTTRTFDTMDEDVPNSGDSDDRDLEVYAKAVAEFKVTWQKQKKEKERRFLRAAKAELDQYVDRKANEVEGIMQDMERTYQDFLSKYAALEDRKREVIVEICEVQKTLVTLSVKKHQEMVALADNREEAGLEAVKLMKETFQDLSVMVDSFMKVDDT